MHRPDASSSFDRRQFLATTIAAAATTSTLLSASASADESAPKTASKERRFLYSLKSGMVQDPACKSWAEKFQMLKDLGYDGVEYDQGLDANPHDIAAASERIGLPVQGLVNPYHWNVRLSDPDPATREKAVANMQKALRFAKTVGASTVLLVPGKVSDATKENFDQCWQRSIEGIRRIIPLAAELGVRICLENVWNQFLYDHNGPGNQKPDQYIKYVDEIRCSWVGQYFDMSNHRKYGNPAEWLRAMGTRVIKCDTKDFKLSTNSFCDVGDGDVPWPEVRQACADINYYGWVSSEVRGGDRKRLTKALEDLKKVLF